MGTFKSIWTILCTFCELFRHSFEVYFYISVIYQSHISHISVLYHSPILVIYQSYTGPGGYLLPYLTRILFLLPVPYRVWHPGPGNSRSREFFIFRCASISCFQVVSEWVSQWVILFSDLQSIQSVQSIQSIQSLQIFSLYSLYSLFSRYSLNTLNSLFSLCSLLRTEFISRQPDIFFYSL